MPNPLYNALNNNPMTNMLKQFNEFKKTLTGNPRDEVQRLLNSGQMTQAQYDSLQAMAQQFMGLMK